MRQMSTLWSNSASVLKSNAVTKASHSLGHGLAVVMAILAERAQAPLQLLSAAFHSSPAVVNQLFRQRQVCLKGIHHDQHRRITVSESASHNRQPMLTSNTLSRCRRSHISP